MADGCCDALVWYTGEKAHEVVVVDTELVIVGVELEVFVCFGERFENVSISEDTCVVSITNVG